MSATTDLIHDVITEIQTEAATAELAISSVVACGLVVVGTVVAQRWWPRAEGPTPFVWRLARVLVVGVMFVELSVQVSMAGWLTDADAATLHWFTEHRSVGWTRAAQFVTDAGSPAATALFGLLLAGLIAWRRRSWNPAAVLLALLAAAAGASTLCKLVVGRARPPASAQLVSATGFSYPSGHTTGTAALLGAVLVVYGAGRWNWPRRVFAATFGAVIVGVIAATRLYLGVHWLTDVIGGLLLGLLVFLAGSLFAGARICHSARRKPGRMPQTSHGNDNVMAHPSGG